MSFSFNSNNITRGDNWKAKSTRSSLPLYYKDKPNKGSNKIIMLFKGFVLSVILYGVYLIASSSKSAIQPSSDWARAQEHVKEVFLDSWHHYETYGWGKDVFHPISETGENMGQKPLGWMIVDSLDTLALMDAKEELARARSWVRDVLDYRFDYDVNLFETTIRMLGGLLSAFHLTEDDLYLDKAVDLANALQGGFTSNSGVPYSSVNLFTGEGVKNHVDNGASSTAEVATLQLEFKYLAFLTGEVLYWQKVEKVMEVLDGNKPVDGLAPIYVQPDTGKYQGSLIRLGSRGDSYYEYLLKQYQLTNNQEPIYWDMYRESVAGVKKHLVRKSKPNGLTFIGELEHGLGGELLPKMDHLVCFYGGLLAMGATNGLTLKEARKLPSWNEEKESDFKLGEELTYTCYKMYADVASGLSPEIVVFNEDEGATEDFFIKPLDRHNLQRPETVESLFFLYRLTGDIKYRKWGLEIFNSFVEHTKVTNKKGEVTYTSLDDVTQVPPRKKDNAESFWFAETLKYLYLLFDDENKVPLDKYVFNTEAHPFPRFDLTETLKTGWKRQVESVKQKPAPVNVDKHKLPEAQPVNKPAHEELLDEVKKNPDLIKDGKKEAEQKLNKIIEGMAS